MAGEADVRKPHRPLSQRQRRQPSTADCTRASTRDASSQLASCPLLFLRHALSVEPPPTSSSDEGTCCGPMAACGCTVAAVRVG